MSNPSERLSGFHLGTTAGEMDYESSLLQESREEIEYRKSGGLSDGAQHYSTTSAIAQQKKG
jgi:hypothetical protein